MKEQTTTGTPAGTRPRAARTLILLTYNEIAGASKLCGLIPWDCTDETFVVDGGSSDGTVEFLKSKGLRVLGQDRRGRGRAFHIGAEAAAGEHLVFFSLDGNEDPADIPRLFEELDKGCDMVIASRMMAGAFNEEDVHLLRPRKWVNQTFTLAVNLLWNRGPYVTDTINGFRGIKKSSFRRLKAFTDRFDIEFLMSIRALKLGMKVAEFPTREGARIGGVSTAESFPTGVLFIKRLWTEIRLGLNF